MLGALALLVRPRIRSLALVLPVTCTPREADDDGGTTDGSAGSSTAGPADGIDDGGPDTAEAPTTDSPSGTTTDPGSDAGTSADGSGSTGAPPSGVPMFVTAGYGFRRAMSCDDGLSWVAQQVTDPEGGDDDTLARGLGWGDGVFVAAVGGGGNTGQIWTTHDGVEWIERVPAGTYNGFSEAVYGNGYHVAAGGHVSIRSSDAITWGEQGTMGEGGILRHVEFGGGAFVAVGGDRVQYGTDGMTWSAPRSSNCDGDYMDVVYGDGAFVAVDGSGHTCRSTDGGASWTQAEIGQGSLHGLVWNGAEFLVTGPDVILHSADGVRWTAADGGGGPPLMARADSGTMVGIDGVDFWRSTDDGFSWTQTDTSDVGPGYARLVFGYASASETCPQ